MAVTDISSALAALTASTGDKVTALEVRQVITWLSERADALEANEVLLLPAVFTGGSTVAPAIRSWVRYNLSGGAGTVTLPTAAASAGLGLVFSERGGLTTALTLDGNGANILAEDGTSAATVNITTANARFTCLYDGTIWEVRGVTPA